MAALITMPKLGLTMTEGIISRWYKSEGDRVEKGEILLEVSTDKITNQLEAPEGGVLRKILVPEGVPVPVTALLGIVAAEDEDISGMLDGNIQEGRFTEEKPAANEEEKVSGADKSQKQQPLIKASPAAKKYAREHGIDLSMVTGTGPGGRIVERDVIRFSENLQRKVKVSPAAAKLASDIGVDIKSIEKDGRIMKEDIMAAVKGQEGVQEEKISPTPMRRVIAQRMAESWHTYPMVTLHVEVDASNLKTLRNQLKTRLQTLSYNDILIKICAKALTEFPYINASYNGQEITLHPDVNIGLAVAVEGGLVVPNVKAAQAKSLTRIAEETKHLIEKAKSNGLTPDDMSGGTFTITNLGMFGITFFTPIINLPETAILGVGAMVDKPAAVDGKVEIRPVMGLSLTFDHRVVDGADGARFLARVKELIEDPVFLLL